MKLIQVNAWCGRLNGPLARFIKEQQPDLLCMQEVYDPKAKSLDVFRDQYQFASEIIQAGSFAYTFFVPAWGFEIGGSLIDIGNAILSKFPLSNLRSFHTHGNYHHRTLSNSIANTRIWQACSVELSNRKLSLSNYQGYLSGADSYGDGVSIETMHKVHDGLAKLDRPLIFCGDLNINTSSSALKPLDNLDLKNLTLDYGVPSTLSSAHRAPERDRQSVACDYIFISPEIQIKNFEVSEEVISDHKALILEFDL